MTVRSEEHGLQGDEVQAILAAHGFGGDRPAAGAALIAVAEPLRVVWANRAATRLFGSEDRGALTEIVFGGRARETLAGAAHGLIRGGGLRTERLRLLQGFRTRTLTVLLSRSARPAGADAIVIEVATPGHGPDPAFWFDALVPADALPEPEPTEAEPVPVLATGRRRFLWRTDAAHRLVEASDGAPGLRDLAVAARRATPLPDLLAGLAVDPDAAVAAALETERAWSGVRVLWPVAGDHPPVPVMLGGVPVRDAAGAFAGFRGFGTAEFGEAPAVPVQRDEAPVTAADLESAADDSEPLLPAAAVPQPRTDPPPDLVATGPDPSGPEGSGPEPIEPEPSGLESSGPPEARPELAGLEPSDPELAGDETATPAEPEPDPIPPPSASVHLSLPPAAPLVVRASFSSAKIVELRPPRLPAGAGPDGPAVEERAAEDEGGRDRGSPASSNLSFVEQLNFGEIARALKDGRAAVPATEPAEEADAVLSVLPVAVLVDRGGEAVYVNQAFLALTGYASLAAFVQAGGRSHLLGGLDAARVAEADQDRAFPVIHATGRVLPVQGRLTTLSWRGAIAEVMSLRLAPDGAAELQGLRFEIARREAEASDYRTLLDRVTDPATVVDGQGRILALNRPGERVFGRDQAGAIGESLGALLTPDSQSAALGAVFRAASAGPDAAEARLAVTARRREGPALPLQARVGALSGGTVGLVFQDEGEVRTQRETIAVLRAERDRSGNARSDFLAKVSHEIRTPLNAILGFAEVMLDERFGPLGNPRYKDYLGDIHAAGRHVIDFVTDLMDLSAVETGQHPLTVAATDVNAIIRESVADMQGQAHRDRVIVRLSLTTGLPRALVDAHAMRQVIDNILSNAIRFNEPGGQVIVSTAGSEEDAITVRVRDTGIGMSDAELAIAMEPFRDISTGKPGGGNGLGLPLTRALVEANQATLSIKSRKSEGTLVEVVLRAAPVEEAAVAPVA